MWSGLPTKYNIRLTVLTTGHDQLARSDAGTGLSIDLSLFDGVKVLESFTATDKGEAFVEPDAEVNVIQPKEGVQSAVTFGPARAGLPLNYTLGESGLFSVSGAAGEFSSLWPLQKLGVLCMASAGNGWLTYLKQPWRWVEAGARREAMGP